MSNTQLKPEPWGVHLCGLGPVLAVIVGNIVIVTGGRVITAVTGRGGENEGERSG